MKFAVIGAGMSGLLAAVMLRDDCVELIDKASSLPNNHHALLRFRSSVVGDVTNVPFKKVQAFSHVFSNVNPIADAFAYSKKVTGRYSFRSIMNIQQGTKERFIAPPDLLQRWHKAVVNQAGTKISWSHDVRHYAPSMLDRNSDVKVISTIPMPDLMRMTGWREIPEFEYQQIMVIEFDLNHCDAYVTGYFPWDDYVSRASITGNKVIIEIPIGSARDEAGTDQMAQMVMDNHRAIISNILSEFGIDSVDAGPNLEIYRQTYGKIVPIDDDLRKRFILYASEQFGIFSLGRFATWRPGLLMDDVVNDVRVIQRIAEKQSNYDHKK